MSQPLDDRGPQLPLDGDNLVRQRWLRHVQSRCGLCQRTLLHDGDQAPQCLMESIRRSSSLPGGTSGQRLRVSLIWLVVACAGR